MLSEGFPGTGSMFNQKMMLAVQEVIHGILEFVPTVSYATQF